MTAKVTKRQIVWVEHSVENDSILGVDVYKSINAVKSEWKFRFGKLGIVTLNKGYMTMDLDGKLVAAAKCTEVLGINDMFWVKRR